MSITKELEHKIYIEAYKIHLEDIKFSKENNVILYGMCRCLRGVISSFRLDISPDDLPAFMSLKPKNKDTDDFWWSIKNTNRTRIKKFKYLIDITK